MQRLGCVYLIILNHQAMRFLLSICLLFTFVFASKGQVDVTIHMHQKLGDQPFAHNAVVQTAAGYYVKITRLQYYISEVRLIHDGGQITPVADQYFLVAPATDSILDLGSFDITTLEGIEYSLGVDAGHNHLDPAIYPSSHPLAPKNPSMHWGWTAGYRFIALEGFAGATAGAVTNNFQIHTIDDSNYKTVSMNTAGELTEGHLAIHVNADYLKMFEGINAQNGIISHAANGASKKQMDNLEAIVFSAEGTTGTIHLDPSIEFAVSPNPSKGLLHLSYDLSKFRTSELVVSDLTGRIMSRQFIPVITNDFTFEMDVPTGAYIINVISDGNLVVSRKVSIQN
jgi:hypothetical protein